MGIHEVFIRIGKHNSSSNTFLDDGQFNTIGLGVFRDAILGKGKFLWWTYPLDYGHKVISTYKLAELLVRLGGVASIKAGRKLVEELCTLLPETQGDHYRSLTFGMVVNNTGEEACRVSFNEYIPAPF